MAEIHIRHAGPQDLARVQEIVEQAYRPYVDRLGLRPGPMDEDYASIIQSWECHVAEGTEVCGLIVLQSRSDTLLLDNIAVSPDYHGKGIGRHLLDFAEASARTRGFMSITLYTHEKMTENLKIYAARGYQEIDRRHENGFDRVYMRKHLV